MPLRAPFVTGAGTTTERRLVLVHLEGHDGAQGWGEISALEHPYYLPETISGAFALACEWALPTALAGDPDPAAVAERLSHIRGNTFARAGVEAAFWCLAATRAGVSLQTLLSQASGTSANTQVVAGASIGICPSVDATLLAVGRALASGYHRIKLKVRPGWDVPVVSAVRDHLGPGTTLQVDANATYSLAPEHRAALLGLDRLGLACIEQPLGWQDLEAHAELQRQLSTPICLDESLRSVRDVQRALERGACRSVNLKPGRVGGIAASLAIREICEREHVALWCGGMLESGIGRAINLALASLSGFSEPGDLSPPLERFERDLVNPPYELSAHGTVAVPRAPGLGFTVTPTQLHAATLNRIELVGERAGERAGDHHARPSPPATSTMAPVT